MTTSVEHYLATTPAVEQWLRVSTRTHHGICLPLFSLHSAASGGIGEFPDLILLISWCHSLGLDVVQLLPLNDTGIDSSPYSALSAFALNPLHLGFTALPYFKDDPALMMMLKKVQKETASQRIDYAKLIPLRESLLQVYYKIWGEALLQSNDYQAFHEKHREWLTGYALFKALKIKHHWQCWQDWPTEQQNPTLHMWEQLQEALKKEIDYHCVVQYLCYQQMEQVKKYADSLRVLIKGDIPILVNRESADVWHHRNLFNMDFTAGAPPDQFSEEGQNWGFPIYNWENMEIQGYRWWRQRLEYSSNFYHLYRIDHVVGFFRIWAIPAGHLATEGEFHPQDECLWIPQGEKLMRMLLSASPLLPIGEDLGIVPPEVRRCLHQMGICGTKVMRWERNWNGDQQYIDPRHYSPLSMTTVSTHDSETLTQWWQNQTQEADLYAAANGWEYVQPLPVEQRSAILRASHLSGSLFHINLLQEYLQAFPELSWDDPDDERINIPGLVSDINWSYRFRPSLEDMIQHADLSSYIRNAIQ